MKQPEAKFKTRLLESFDEVAGKKGWSTYVIPTMGMKKGIPDLFFSWRGRCAWIEAKVLPNDLSSAQQHTIGCMLCARLRVVLLAESASGETIEEHYYHDQLENPKVRFWQRESVKEKGFWKAILGIGHAA